MTNFTRHLPDGKIDSSSYEQIEAALDDAGAPATLDEIWLRLPARIRTLAVKHKEEVAWYRERKAKLEAVSVSARMVRAHTNIAALERDASELAGHLKNMFKQLVVLDAEKPDD